MSESIGRRCESTETVDGHSCANPVGAGDVFCRDGHRCASPRHRLTEVVASPDGYALNATTGGVGGLDDLIGADLPGRHQSASDPVYPVDHTLVPLHQILDRKRFLRTEIERAMDMPASDRRTAVGKMVDEIETLGFTQGAIDGQKQMLADWRAGERRPAIEVEGGWEQAGPTGDPGAVLHLANGIVINGVDLHLEAIAVTSSDDGLDLQQAAAPEHDEDLDHLSALAGERGRFATATIQGREYVIHAVPYCD